MPDITVTKRYVLRESERLISAGNSYVWSGGGGLAADGYYTKTEADDLFVHLTGDETVAGVKTFTGANVFYSGQKINNPANTFYYTLTSAAIAANRILNLPLITGTDTLAVLGLAQTFSGAITLSATPLTLSANSAILSFSSATGAKRITTGGSTYLALMPGGSRVGIGTASPLKQCTLYGTEAAITPRLLLQSGSATNPSGSTIDWWCSTDADYGSNPTARISGYRVASGAVGELKLSVRGASATLNDGMILTSYWGGSARSTVRVGINNMSPTEALDVEDNIQYSGYLKGDEIKSKSTAFVSGFAGTGYKMIRNSDTDSSLELDNITIRKSLKVYELLIQRIRASGGSFWFTEGHKLETVTENSDGSFTCEIDTDDGNLLVEFQDEDIVRCQHWTGRGVKYYTAEVTAINSDASNFTMTVIDGTDEPEAGDEVVRIGSAASSGDRSGSVYITSSDDNAPYIDVLDGVVDEDLSDKVMVRVGKLDGITDADLGGALSGYGLYGGNVYLKGKIVATSGEIGGWTIDTDAIYTGTKKTDEGYTTDGITLASNGSIRSKFFEIKETGYAKFESVDSIFKATNIPIGDLDGTYVLTQANVVGAKRKDQIVLSGSSGDAYITCDEVTKTVTFASDLPTTAINFKNAFAADYLAAGVVVTNSGGTLYFESTTKGLDFVGDTTISNHDGDLDGTPSVIQASITPVARIDTITLEGTGGTATIVVNGVTAVARWNDDGLAATAIDFVDSYAEDFADSGVELTADSGGEDLIFTAMVAGEDFSGATSVTNLANPYRGSVKIHGNEIWENDEENQYGAILINRKGFEGGTSQYRRLVIGNGKGWGIASFDGGGEGFYFGTISFLCNRFYIYGLPTSSSGLATGCVWRDGTTLKIVV